MDASGHYEPETTGNARLWILLLVALVAWQAWWTVGLFGPDPLHTLVDDRPIVSGSHPLHLYFGWLGASSLRSTGSLYCYDPAFQAGYPKTPVFDSGSRPAELFLSLAGGAYSPAAYKIGLACCCLAVPLLLAVTARGAGLTWAMTAAVVAVGLLVWGGGPCQKALEAGDVDLLLGGLCAAAAVGLLLAYHRAPGLRSWLGMLVLGTLGWFANPFLFLVLFPLLLVYYLTVGPRHRLGWHAGLFGVLLAAPGLNAFWLVAWLRSWWLRLPLQLESVSLPHRTWQTFWDAPCWGDPADRLLTAGIMMAGFLGVLFLNQMRERPAARLLGLGAGGLSLLTLAGMAWPTVGRFGTGHLMVPAIWFAIPAAVFAVAQITALFGRWTGAYWRGALLTGACLGALALLALPITGDRAGRLFRSAELEVGLRPERTAIIETLKALTQPDARILWEERTSAGTASRWTALLPLLADRALIGGLGPDVCIEHAYAGLVGEKLAGRPIADWSDTDLAQFFRRYNIGWAVCWSPRTLARLQACAGAQVIARLSDDGDGALLSFQPRSYVLKGKARWLDADSRHITLADVVPEDGMVVVSLHYQGGLQASPPRVQIEREPDPHDPIPLVRLRVPAPVSHLTLTWRQP
jgi:hypothetical protein